MSEPHDAHESHDHAHEEHISDSTFFKVFVGLFVFTIISFLANQVFGAGIKSFAIIGTVAILKALLVVVFFMHLKIDWKKLFVFIVPVMILAPMLIVTLVPDIWLAWRLTP